jgi:hypothetical protein
VTDTGTAPPSAVASGSDPAGRCAGTAGPAAATTGPPEPSRLASLSLNEMNRWIEEAVTGSEIECQAAARELLDVVRHEYRRANLLELRALNAETEGGRLTAALAAVTHEFDPTPSTACEACFRPRSHPVHRTPASVRAELEER